ncbi:MAG: hypothetical protein ABI945_07845 [Nitrospirales bacterium]
MAYTTVKGPGGFDDTQTGSALTQEEDCNSGSMTGSRSMGPLATVARRCQLARPEYQDKNFRDSGQMVTVGINFHF